MVVVSGVLTVGVSGTPLVAVLALCVTTVSFSAYAARLPELTRLLGGIPAAGATMTVGGLAVAALRDRRDRPRHRGAARRAGVDA